MNEPRPSPFTPALTAYVAPFGVFMAFLALAAGLKALGRPEFAFSEPAYWVYPLQTVVCAALLWHYRRFYHLERPRQVAFTLGAAILVLVLWISPQELFGVARRVEGFDPEVFAPGSPLYWGTLGMRLLRLVVVVPLLEEIFWRGFLLRYLIREDFEKIPFGSASRFSFLAVTLCFALVHSWADFFPALATGALYNWVAIRTRSLSACVLAHAVTNLLLGAYILATRQWGFW